MKNFISIISLLCLLFLGSPGAEASGENSWEDFAPLLGMNAKKAAAALRKYADISEDRNYKSEKIISAEAIGISLLIRSDIVSEIHFQMSPGKKVSDKGYSGTLPLIPSRATWFSYTIADARSSLGEPIFEGRERAYTTLLYPKDNFFVVLYFLDSNFAGLAIRKA